MSDVAFPYEVKVKEIINGIIVAMAPARPSHQRVGSKLWRTLDKHFHDKTCEVFFETYVQLSKKERYAPDICIVCNPEIVKENAIMGAPDMVAEVLSASTFKRDKGHKKDAYEKYGVKEYWIIDTDKKLVEVYILQDGRYHLDEVYKHHYNELDLEFMTKEEIDEITYEIKLSSVVGVVVDVREIFEGMV